MQSYEGQEHSAKQIKFANTIINRLVLKGYHFNGWIHKAMINYITTKKIKLFGWKRQIGSLTVCACLFILILGHNVNNKQRFEENIIQRLICPLSAVDGEKVKQIKPLIFSSILIKQRSYR